jgi:hypothetical protein
LYVTELLVPKVKPATRLPTTSAATGRLPAASKQMRTFNDVTPTMVSHCTFNVSRKPEKARAAVVVTVTGLKRAVL